MRRKLLSPRDQGLPSHDFNESMATLVTQYLKRVKYSGPDAIRVYEPGNRIPLEPSYQTATAARIDIIQLESNKSLFEVTLVVYFDTWRVTENNIPPGKGKILANACFLRRGWL